MIKIKNNGKRTDQLMFKKHHGSRNPSTQLFHQNLEWRWTLRILKIAESLIVCKLSPGNDVGWYLKWMSSGFNLAEQHLFVISIWRNCDKYMNCEICYSLKQDFISQISSRISQIAISLKRVRSEVNVHWCHEWCIVVIQILVLCIICTCI